MALSDHIRKKLSALPHKPGIYLMKDRFGTVINDAHYGRVEDAQMGICHMLCYAFMENPEWAK